MSTDRIRYRPDIDGLRAIAILAVVGFHAFPAFFPGGYLGVDVFFVVSGYLITGIIRDQAQTGRFSITDFYAGRVRRLAPSLIAVLAAVYLIGLGGLLAAELADLGGQMAAAAGFVANLRFALESGYFDTTAETKPLLHLWSLGVEEQFYLFWPILMTIVVTGRARFVATLFIAITSFGVGILGAKYFPSANFLLPFGRLWELLMGAAIALREPREWRLDRHPNIFGIVGIFLVLSSLFFADSGTFGAIFIAASGAALLILSGSETRIGNLLGARPLRYLGKISYPLYIWHWPILVFLRVFRGEEPSFVWKLGAIMVTFALSALTFRFIETPIRFGRPPIKSDRRATYVLASLVALLGAIGLFTVHAEGFPGRICGVPSALAERDVQRKSSIDRGCPLDRSIHAETFWCRTAGERPNYALVGDSHAQALWVPVARGSSERERWVAFATPGCIPFPKVNREANRPDCDRVAEATFGVLESPEVKSVLFVVSSGSLNFDQHDSAYFDRILGGADDAIRNLIRRGKRVTILIDNPRVSANPERCGQVRPFEKFGIHPNPHCAIDREKHESNIYAMRRFVALLRSKNPTLEEFDPTEFLCPGGQCPAVIGGRAVYTYDDHLSDYGVSRFIEALRETVRTK